MKNVILALVLALMLFGCMGQPPAVPQEPTDNVSEGVEVTEQPYTGPLCEPDYSFSELSAAGLSEGVEFKVTAACADGKTVSLVLNDETVGTYDVSGNEQVVINFQLVAKKDGTNNVKVLVDSESVYHSQWEVSPLGNSEFSPTDYDLVSIKEWRAYAFDIDNTVEITNIQAYLRRLYSQVKPGTTINIEVRGDSNGNPASTVLASTSQSLDVATLNEKWISFEFENGVSLDEGKYWLVFKVVQTADNLVSDVVNVYYLPVNKESPGNDYTRMMRLEWSDDTEEYLETTWQPLPFDKNYAIVISAE